MLTWRSCWFRHPMWCRRRRPRTRPQGLERVPGAWRCRIHHPTTPRRTPPVKTRRRKKKPLPPPVEGGKKRKAAPTEEAEGSKKGKTLPSDYSTDADDGEEEWPHRARRPAAS